MQHMNKALLVWLLLVLSYSYCLAQPETYRYKRTISNAAEGWHSIPLPTDIFSRLSPNLADLRIWGITADKDTLEMPYLLKNTAGKVTLQEVPFRLINQSRNSKGYYYTLELAEALPLNQIVLKFGNRNFDWRVKLEGSHTQGEWFTVLEDYRILAIQNQHTDYSFTRLSFPTIQYQYLRLQINSNEKPVLMPFTLIKTEKQAGDYQTYSVSFRQEELKKEKQTIIDIKLPQVVPLSSLALQLADTIDYYRPLTILYPADSTKTASGWQYHYRSLYSGTVSSLEKAQFSFNSTLTSRLRIVIDNRQNLPLKIAGTTVKGFRYSLATRLGAAQQYWLVYGKPTAAAPEYDIALFEDKIPATLSPLALEQEEILTENLPAKSPLFSNKAWLWALMLILIGVMGWFTLKMLSTAQQQKEV